MVHVQKIIWKKIFFKKIWFFKRKMPQNDTFGCIFILKSCGLIFEQISFLSKKTQILHEKFFLPRLLVWLAGPPQKTWLKHTYAFQFQLSNPSSGLKKRWEGDGEVGFSGKNGFFGIFRIKWVFLFFKRFLKRFSENPVFNLKPRFFNRKSGFSRFKFDVRRFHPSAQNFSAEHNMEFIYHKYFSCHYY